MSREQLLYEAIENGCFSECKRLLQNKNDYDIVNKEHDRKLPLCWACENNNYDIVELFLKLGADVNRLDIYDQGPLAYAVESADIEVIKLLVKSGAKLNSCDINGIYPLHVAINRKDDEICDYLINEGAFINIVDKEGCSPLSFAIINDYTYMIYKLLKLGADPNVSDYNGDTPLIKALWSTSSVLGSEQVFKICKTLIEYGADVNVRNENGRTALFTAIYENNTDVALLLIQNGASFDIDDTANSNFTLLHYACYQGNYVLAKTLLEKNCDPNCMSSSGESPIYIATTKGYVDIVELLIDHGANVNIIFGHLAVNRCTLLQATVYYIKDYQTFKSIVDILVKAKINLGVSDPVPILNVCLQYNKFDFAKYLLVNGAPIDNSPHYYQSCFYKAFLMKNIEFMELCLLSGFSMNKMVPWIEEYLEYPNIENEQNSNNYRLVNLFRNNRNEDPEEENEPDDLEEINSLMRMTDEEISEMLAIDEYFLEKLHSKQRKIKQKENSKKKEFELARNIYMMVKHFYTHPLSLQELARIQIRRSLIKVDYKVKEKIEHKLPLPNRLKNYLLFKDIIAKL